MCKIIEKLAISQAQAHQDPQLRNVLWVIHLPMKVLTKIEVQGFVCVCVCVGVCIVRGYTTMSM